MDIKELSEAQIVVHLAEIAELKAEKQEMILEAEGVCDRTSDVLAKNRKQIAELGAENKTLFNNASDNITRHIDSKVKLKAEIAELEAQIVSIRRVCIADANSKAKEIAELKKVLLDTLIHIHANDCDKYMPDMIDEAYRVLEEKR